jgi:DNA invertase Pin-like site-specific DNA recombinase
MTEQTIGYLRVSTDGQDLEKNKNDILKLANERKLGYVDFVEEKVSGKVYWRDRKISDVIETLTKGDTIIVSELSRLSRSMLECMEILSVVSKKGINLFAVKGNWTLDGSLQSKITSMVFSMLRRLKEN